MISIFRKGFSLFPGEEKRAALFALLAFLWAVAVTAGLKFADALFLIHVGSENLPIAYSISAGCMILIASFLIYGFHHFEAHKIFICALAVGVVFYLLSFLTFSYKIGLESKWLWYTLRVFGSINFAVIVTCFWTFLDQYFHLQDAKRLFSLFTSMIFLGVATTGFIMLLGLIEFGPLSLLIAAALTLTIFLVLNIQRSITPVHDEGTGDIDSRSQEITISTFLQAILKSKFTLLLMGSNLLIYLLLVTTEYNYFGEFQKEFGSGAVLAGDEADAKLTQFLGKALACVSLTNLIFGLFFYSRLLRRFGIQFLMPITSTFLIVAYSGWMLGPPLIFALLGYFVVEGTLYVIDDSNFNLLLNAVPTRLKNKIRICIESFFEPIGTLLAAGLLSLAWINPKIMGLILSIVLLTLVFFLQRNYLKAIYQNLTANAIPFGKKAIATLLSLDKKEKKRCESRLLAILRQGENQSKVFSMECLSAFEDRSILSKWLEEMELLSISDKISFIRIIAESDFNTDVKVIETAQRWLYETNDPVLLSEIYWFLAKQGLLHPDWSHELLAENTIKTRAAAILSLKLSQVELDSETLWKNKLTATQEIQKLLEEDDPFAIIMGLKILSQDPSQTDLEIAINFLLDPSAQITRQAAKTVAKIADERSVKQARRIFDALEQTLDSETRLYLLEAIGKIKDASYVEKLISIATYFRPLERRKLEEIISSMGLKNIPLLITLVKDQTLHPRLRLIAGKALGKLSVYQLRAQLERILKPEVERALFYFYHLHNVEGKDADFNLLKDALKSGYFSVLDFIIQILGQAGEIEDCELLSRSMRSQNVKLRSQVIEALEKSCEPKIFRLLLPLLEESPNEIKEGYYIKIGGKPLSITSLLLTMERSSSLADEIVAYAYMQKLNVPGWQEALKKHMTVSEEIFKKFAYELLDQA